MTSWTNSIGGSAFTGALPAPQIAKTPETLRNQGFRYFGARDGTEPKATSLAITGLRYLVASFMPPKMPPKRKVPLGVCVLSPTMPKHYREGRECYAEGVTGAIPRNANFGDAGKRLPPSFGSAAAPDFLPPPPRQRGVVVVLHSRFRCRIRREASSLQGLYKLGRRKWKQQPTLKSSYEAKGRGSNYPQPGWAWGEPKWWGVGVGAR